MARAPFPIADRVSLAEVGEYMKRKNDLHEGLARDDVQAALVDGCGVELIWIKEGREVCREYPEPDSEPDFWRRPILSWHGVLPRRLHVQLPPEEQKGDQLITFLRLTDAVRYGLQPVSELPQAQRQPQQLPAATRPDKPAITDPASAASTQPLKVDPVNETGHPSPRPSAPATDVRDLAGAETAASPSASVASTEEPQKERSDETAAAAPMVSEWDPRTEWSVALVKRELQIEGPDKEMIIEALPKLYGNNIPAILDGLVAGKSPQAEKLRKAIKELLEETAQPPGRTIRDREIPSRDTCSRFLVAWREYRARQSHQ